MQLPFQDFEDQRSGETLSILTKVRTDTEKFIAYFINVFLSIIVSVVFLFLYMLINYTGLLFPIYMGAQY